jgi:hypothetical protein
MPNRIINLQLVLQRYCSERATKNVVRRDNRDGPFKNRTIDIPVNIPIGPDSDANAIIRRLVAEKVRRHAAKAEVLFYVVAEFAKEDSSESDSSESDSGPGDGYFKTVVPRTEITLSLRRV